MSGILFILPSSPLAFNHSGAASRYAQNFLALHRQGEELHVLRFHTKGKMQTVLDFEADSPAVLSVRKAAASWREVELPDNLPRGRLDSLARLLFDPLAGEFPQAKSLAVEIRAQAQALQPYLLWAEHSDAAAALWQASLPIAWVYSSTDMRYLIRSIRSTKKSFFKFISDIASHNAEVKVTRKADCVLTGSVTEKERLEEFGCKNVKVIPTVNDDLPKIDLDIQPAQDVKIIHLGSLETTANRSGLQSYLSLAHPRVMASRLPGTTLLIIGDSTRVKTPLSDLLNQPGVVRCGYISDLGSVLRPYDIAILPYSQDSGYRTKLPLLMGYAQVILATRASVVGSLLPGLDQVCVLVDRVDEFPEGITWLFNHPDERKQLGQAGRAFAEQHFSLKAVQPLYADLLHQKALAS